MQPKQSLSVPIAIVVAGGLIALGLYMSGRSNSGQPSTANTGSNRPAASLDSIKPISSNDHILGSSKAKAIIVEYSDTECPFCKNFHSTLRQIVDSYNGQVAWVYRHFPVHNRSVDEAEALECAAELGGNDVFWKYTDKVFAQTNSNDSLDPAALPQIASSVGLDVTKFNACLSSNKYEKNILDDRQAVIDAGAQGTPYSVIFVNGQKIPITQGALPFPSMKSIIDTVLKAS